LKKNKEEEIYDSTNTGRFKGKWKGGGEKWGGKKGELVWKGLKGKDHSDSCRFRRVCLRWEAD